jgi:hypothetical protein
MRGDPARLLASHHPLPGQDFLPTLGMASDEVVVVVVVVVRPVNLDYLDPATVDLDAIQADPDILVLPQAGEVR